MTMALKRLGGACVLGIILAGSVTMGSTRADAGFFDQLFGGPAPQPQPSYAYPAEAQPDQPAIDPAPRSKRVAREIPMVRQKTTDLMHDKTLRVGDAVMMKDGLHVYDGPGSSKHSAKQFVPVTTARVVSSKERAALLAMDVGHVDPLRGASGNDTLASGRSAAVAVPVSKGFRITDARGASIRYVGP